MNPSVRNTLIGVAVTLPVISSSRCRRFERIVDARVISVGSILLPAAGTGLLTPGCWGFDGREEDGVGSGMMWDLGTGDGVPFMDEAFALRALEEEGLGRESSTP